MHGTISIISSKLEVRVRPDLGDRGVFAKEPITKGEFLVACGGLFITKEALDRIDAEIRIHGLQVEEDLFLVSEITTSSDFVNHSCEPNAGLSGQIIFIALRDIAIDEEVCYDYAMSDGSDYDEFECTCNTSACRKSITGNDWSIPTLWQKYKGHFSPYLQRRIDRLQTIREKDDSTIIIESSRG